LVTRQRPDLFESLIGSDLTALNAFNQDTSRSMKPESGHRQTRQLLVA
jgi:hypothetical protein